MPPHASANPEIKQIYINGHFCYVFKFGIVTNGLGIIRHIPFYNKDFFSKHPLINPQTFLGDAALDSVGLYKELLSGNTFGDDKHFTKAYIPLNSRAHLENVDYTINENGTPCCPRDASLPMKVPLNFVVALYAANLSARKIYIYPEKDLRAYPDVLRGTQERNDIYKIRTVVERNINHIKDNLCLAGRRRQNEKTLHADSHGQWFQHSSST